MTSLLAELASTGISLPNLWPAICSASVFGAVGIVLLLLGYWLFDWITPRIDVQKELAEKNLAVAIVVGSLLLGIAYIVAHVVSA
jgi:putative membrane protein